MVISIEEFDVRCRFQYYSFDCLHGALTRANNNSELSQATWPWFITKILLFLWVKRV